MSIWQGQPCPGCGWAWNGDADVAQAYWFLYDEQGSSDISLDRDDFLEHLTEAILDMGNDTPRQAASAAWWAMMQAGGFPEPEDLQAAVLHRASHPEGIP